MFVQLWLISAHTSVLAAFCFCLFFTYCVPYTNIRLAQKRKRTTGLALPNLSCCYVHVKIVCELILFFIKFCILSFLKLFSQCIHVGRKIWLTKMQLFINYPLLIYFSYSKNFKASKMKTGHLFFKMPLTSQLKCHLEKLNLQRKEKN